VIARPILIGFNKLHDFFSVYIFFQHLLFFYKLRFFAWLLWKNQFLSRPNTFEMRKWRFVSLHLIFCGKTREIVSILLIKKWKNKYSRLKILLPQSKLLQGEEHSLPITEFPKSRLPLSPPFFSPIFSLTPLIWSRWINNDPSNIIYHQIGYIPLGHVKHFMKSTKISFHTFSGIFNGWSNPLEVFARYFCLWHCHTSTHIVGLSSSHQIKAY